MPAPMKYASKGCPHCDKPIYFWEEPKPKDEPGFDFTYMVMSDDEAQMFLSEAEYDLCCACDVPQGVLDALSYILSYQHETPVDELDAELDAEQVSYWKEQIGKEWPMQKGERVPVRKRRKVSIVKVIGDFLK